VGLARTLDLSGLNPAVRLLLLVLTGACVYSLAVLLLRDREVENVLRELWRDVRPAMFRFLRRPVRAGAEAAR